MASSESGMKDTGLPPASWNDTAAEFPRCDLVELFDDQARRRPKATALRYEGRSVRYLQLMARANQLAHHLRSMGIGPGDRVGICTDRSPDMVIGLLGILKAGAAYVPLDPYYPRNRLEYMLSDAGVAALVTQERWGDSLPETGIATIRLDRDAALLSEQDTDSLPVQTSGEDLAYVIYTSGSTGKPKGVAIRRAALVNFLWAMKRIFAAGHSDIYLALTTISFDIAGLEIFLPLVTGGRAVLATREDATEARRLARLIEEERVTVAQATPATWRMLLDSHWHGSRNLRILCGGEAMTRHLANQLLARGAEVWNMYGPTETTIWSTLCRIEPGDEPISIGRPIANTQVHLLDEQLRPVPVGQVGELHIGGAGLARGYLNRPELTAEKFIPDPFSSVPGARLYKTGDLARYWPDGRIECLGRVDHQVKIRGFRIELTEIEAILGSHKLVKAAAVTAHQDRQGEQYLAAYWVPRSDAKHSLDAGALRQYLGRTLPSHMVPSVFVEMDALPLTPNGKIDRRALPVPDRATCVPRSEPVEATTETQRRLVEIWQNMLGIRPIGIRDDFFVLGGHSLAAARIVARIESVLGISVPVSTLLTAPTIESLARILDGEVENERSGIVFPFRKTGSRPPLFLVAGVGGHVLIFRELARLLGDEQPVFGLQGIGLDGKEPPISNMERIARRYIEEIVSIQPQGPYYISGWSMGGVIAYEIARQLLAEGRELGALIVLDAYAPWALSFSQRLRLHLDSIRKRPWRSRLRYIWQRITHQCEAISRRLGYDRPAEGLTGPTADRVRDSSLAQFEALRRYRPGPLPADLVLLRAEQTAEIRDPRADDPQLGWGALVQGRIDVLPIRGSHTGIFVGQNVEHVAAAFNRALTLTMPSPDISAAGSSEPCPDTSQEVSGKSVAQSLG